MRLADLEGRPVVLNFWASTCVPCQKEMPDFQQLPAEGEGGEGQLPEGDIDLDDLVRRWFRRRGRGAEVREEAAAEA